jgi:hypothetical protein
MAQAFRTIIWAAMNVCLRFEMEKFKDVRSLKKEVCSIEQELK